MTECSPTELRLSADKSELRVTFNPGEDYTLSAEMLRVMSPSAEVQGHGPSQRKLVGGKRLVKISKIEPIGHYAVRIVFDDLHDSGIFTWQYLHELGSGRAAKWATYLSETAEKGVSRG
ncbi:MAG: DUF971 domain-containing protein [Hyphomicrobiales bacterium]|nr:DUF971 domain-containing protein [Hyphomicrobiales bacterium]